MVSDYHNPVLLKECIEGLNVKSDGVYADVTFGGGGHAREILKHLINGKLYAFDQDEDAVKNTFADKRFKLIRQNFRHLKKSLHENGVEKIDGLLADFGVSSYQFDTKVRGFSTRFDGPLDMRMDKNLQVTAAKILNEYKENQLKKIFKEYGELKNSSQIVREIVNERKRKKVNSVNELKDIIKKKSKPGKENQFYAKVFQALRIEVNDELNVLKELLIQSAEIIKSGGRLVLISYHSLEDRLVKNFIKSGKFEGEAEKDFYGNKITPFNAINKKPVEPSKEEISNNPRARSAKLRIAEKI